MNEQRVLVHTSLQTVRRGDLELLGHVPLPAHVLALLRAANR